MYAALLTFNTAVLFLIINFGYYAVKSIKHMKPGPVKKYGIKKLTAIYPHLNEQEVKALLKETWSRPYVFEPFTQFKERAFHGDYVNVDAHGFRFSKNQGPWPPAPGTFNIFLFGGSTTFGYGVEDNQTIASHLKEYLDSRLNLKINIYNFGRGFYYSTQERILFEQLIVAGYVPDMAIFIDGLNDFYFYDDRPKNTDDLQHFVDAENISKILSSFPVTQAIGERKQLSYDRTVNINPKTGKPLYDDPTLIQTVIKRYLTNKKMIEAVSSSYGVKSVFVWQPIPTFKYDLSKSPFAGSFDKNGYSKYGYRTFEEMKEKTPLGKNFLWCADIQQNMKQPLYVDGVHYTALFSRQFAVSIADLLIERKFFSN